MADEMYSKMICKCWILDLDLCNPGKAKRRLATVQLAEASRSCVLNSVKLRVTLSVARRLLRTLESDRESLSLSLCS